MCVDVLVFLMRISDFIDGGLHMVMEDCRTVICDSYV